MSRIPLVRPDVLVLAGGGTLGEAWMTGLLAGIEDSSGLDLRATESFVGTSAGSIVAARLAAGVALRRPRSVAPAVEASGGRGETHGGGGETRGGVGETSEPTGDDSPLADAGAGLLVAGDRAADPGALDWLERTAAPVLAPIIGPALRLERLPAEIIRGVVLSLLPDGTRSLAELERAIERDRSRFDGRLRIVVVDRRSGRRVVFGAPGAPDASVARAVAASCAIPGVFRAIEIAGRDYVDGGVWSMTNLDAAPAGRRTELLCLNPIRDLPASPLSRLGLVNRVARGREALELALVRGRGARVRVIGPAPHAGRLMAPSLMDPGPREAVLHAGYAQGVALGQAQ